MLARTQWGRKIKMSEKYSVDYRRVRDLPPTINEYEEIERVSLEHAQKKVPDRAHAYPIRFVGVVPANSVFALKGWMSNQNCVDARYVNNLLITEIEGVMCHVWAVVEPELA